MPKAGLPVSEGPCQEALLEAGQQGCRDPNNCQWSQKLYSVWCLEPESLNAQHVDPSETS